MRTFCPVWIPESRDDATLLLTEKRYSHLSVTGLPLHLETPQSLSPFAGQVVTFTGKLSSLGRREAREVVERLGGIASEDVTTRTTMLVIGAGGVAQPKDDAVDDRGQEPQASQGRTGQPRRRPARSRSSRKMISAAARAWRHPGTCASTFTPSAISLRCIPRSARPGSGTWRSGASSGPSCGRTLKPTPVSRSLRDPAGRG